MQSLLNLQPGENVRAILPVRDLEEEGKFIFFATRKGTVKKTPLKDFSNVMSRGIIAIGIDKDDELVAARITDGSQIVFLATHLGMAIRFDESDVRSMGRPAYGVRGIDLGKSDYVVGVAITPKEHEEGAYRILAVTENGFGKRTNVEEYRLQTRGGSGVKNMAVTERIGKVTTIQLVDDTSELMVISQFGKIIRIDTKTIRAAGRATQGVRLLNLEPTTRSPPPSSFPLTKSTAKRKSRAPCCSNAFRGFTLAEAPGDHHPPASPQHHHRRVGTGGLDHPAVHAPLPAGEPSQPSAQGLALHKPLGVQSCTMVVGRCDDWCRMITIERRSSVPIAVRCIDSPMGTITAGPSVRLICICPSEVSRQVWPPTAYQASGPECVCAGAIMPGVKSASINCAEYFSPATTGRGPVSATRIPPADLQFSSSMVISHTLPNDSTTVPRGPLCASAASPCRIGVEMPEHLRFLQRTNGMIGRSGSMSALAMMLLQ